MAWVAATFAVAGGIASSRASKEAGQAAIRDAYAQAAEIRAQKADVALAATQQHENRMQQFRELVDYNEAMNAYMGRSGRSISALRKREESAYGKDVTRLRLQEQREKDRLEKEAKAVVARGRVTSSAYKTQARLNLFDTATKVASLYNG